MKNLIKKVIIGAGTVLVLGGAGKVIDITMDRFYWNPTKFQERTQEWVTVYNGNGRLWDDYMKTPNYPKNKFNYQLYLKQVDERNNNKRFGTIEVPVFNED